ncbi:hypothetical protein MNBD_NITROSPINAE04-1154 [hydrothermal vent metagenome]|uniref:Uncharacterized protein n=1 Tax=hydrothermal vent metagenome TaxID=652676 RepID=A0A3B1CEN1_9ZZZZ
MEILPWLNGINSFAVIIASVVAIWGINAWRREFEWKKKHDRAEETLTLFYQAKVLIAEIRYPLSNAKEGKNRKALPDETPEEKQALDRANVVVERYNQRKEVFSKIHAMRYRFMALFGKDKVKPFDELFEIISEILFAADYLGNYVWSKRNSDFSDPNELKEFNQDRREYESIFWFRGKNDPISPRVDAVIQEIEKICEPILFSKK